MRTPLQPGIALGGRFARELPELAIPWEAAEVAEPRLLALNEPLAQELGLDPAALRTAEGLRLLVGNAVPDGATPVAQGYAGHQFGSYSPRLGDGRALLLGEVSAADGTLRDIHLKGSGATPFARAGDGLAAVGPMLREFVVAEAMHALGIPTTRSLAVVETGSTVRRETELPGAVLTRVAASHLRVGTFQFVAAGGDTDLLRRLADFAIDRHYPWAAGEENPALALFREVVAAQASLVARWMLVGFVHGVMNTDNMTISGETIDYGPCAFMDAYDPAALYSSIDSGGRYAYGSQPVVAEWNLARLAEALLPLFDEDRDRAVELAVEQLGTFRPAYNAAYAAVMADKLGLPDDDATAALSGELPALLAGARVDHTSFYRSLGAAARGGDARFRALFPAADAGDEGGAEAWLERWRLLGPDGDAADRANPAYIPRNHLVEEALAAATAGDLEPLSKLLDAVTAPFEERPGLERYAAPAPEDFGNYRTFCGT
ncbi:protein adenylyltransferase SelO [Arthrobacter sp. KK5.5]|uniref:protein adenylyltransferase SelO n=1 Tax=Arthrobacter sp. KK5.5 TaxID=3373084 RepID=UPI003EE53F56